MIPGNSDGEYTKSGGTPQRNRSLLISHKIFPKNRGGRRAQGVRNDIYVNISIIYLLGTEGKKDHELNKRKMDLKLFILLTFILHARAVVPPDCAGTWFPLISESLIVFEAVDVDPTNGNLAFAGRALTSDFSVYNFNPVFQLTNQFGYVLWAKTYYDPDESFS